MSLARAARRRVWPSPDHRQRMIVLKSAQDIDSMRHAGRVVAEVLEKMRDMARPGVTTAELDRAATALIEKRGGHPTFKGYRGYPANICTMINHELVHGIPSARRRLKEGDILGLLKTFSRCRHDLISE